MPTWQTLADSEAVAEEAARQISEAAAQAIAERQAFSLVLAGGSTPLACYRLLAKSKQDWQHWTIYYGDERCLAPDDPERNSVMTATTGLLQKVAAHYPIRAENGPIQGALEYSATLSDKLPFDMVILGMGQDGHTASLFPGQHWPDRAVIGVDNAPKPPPQRVSLSPNSLQATRHMLVLVSGNGKREALQAWRDGEKLPIAQVSDISQAQVLVDANCMLLASDQRNYHKQGIQSKG